MHDVFIVGVPLLVILAGILMNRSDVKELKAEISGLRGHVDGELGGLRGHIGSELRGLRGHMDAEIDKLRGHMDAELGKLRGHVDAEIKSLRTELLGRFNVLEADMRQFYHLTGKLEARVDALEKR